MKEFFQRFDVKRSVFLPGMVLFDTSCTKYDINQQILESI